MSRSDNVDFIVSYGRVRIRVYTAQSYKNRILFLCWNGAVGHLSSFAKTAVSTTLVNKSCVQSPD